MSWETLIKPFQYGGLGFINMEALNMALLLKQLWNIVIHP